ncbi:hypothetical protein GCM10027280_37910 [Micromonospora polyrhachis]
MGRDGIDCPEAVHRRGIRAYGDGCRCSRTPTGGVTMLKRAYLTVADKLGFVRKDLAGFYPWH